MLGRLSHSGVHSDVNFWLLIRDVDWINRELKVYDRKIKKAKAKKNKELAQRFDRLRPAYSLDHLVKER